MLWELEEKEKPETERNIHDGMSVTDGDGASKAVFE